METILTELGLRRERLAHDAAELAREIKAAVRQAQGVGMPLARVARLLKLDRSSLYRTYLDAPDE